MALAPSAQRSCTTKTRIACFSTPLPSAGWMCAKMEPRALTLILAVERFLDVQSKVGLRHDPTVFQSAALCLVASFDIISRPPRRP